MIIFCFLENDFLYKKLYEILGKDWPFDFAAPDSNESEKEAVKPKKEDSEHTAPASEKAPEISVQVWFPMWVYEVKVHHKLLSELGEISHFMLKVLNEHTIGLDGLCNMMGFAPEALQPIITRLEGLGLIRGSTLTAQGKQLVSMLHYLHDKTFTVVLDRHYHYGYKDSDILLIRGDSECLVDAPDDVLQVGFPRQVRYRVKEDCFLQMERFRKNLGGLLPLLVPDFNEILPHLGQGLGHENDWDISIDRSLKDKGICVKLPTVPYSKVSAAGAKDAHLTLTSPALVLETRFDYPQGIHWDDENQAAPEPRTLVYSAVDNEISEYDHTEAILEDENYLPVLDTPFESDTQLAEELLEKMTRQLTEQHRYCSIHHAFSERRQMHHYSYRDLVACLVHPDIQRLKP